MTPREIALSICEPWFNGDPCEGCKCHKVCTKLVERIEAAIQAEHVPEIGFGNMAQRADSTGADQSEDALEMVATSQESRQVEPVAYMSMCFSNGQTKPHSKTLFWPEQYTGRTEPVDAGAWGEERVVPLYTATPKRQPLTEEQIEFRFGRKPTKYMMFLIRSTERAHGIGGEE